MKFNEHQWKAINFYQNLLNIDEHFKNNNGNPWHSMTFQWKHMKSSWTSIEINQSSTKLNDIELNFYECPCNLNENQWESIKM